MHETTPPTDSELMAATRRGCRDSFGQLVDRHKDALVAYLARLTGSPERAEDLAQDAFLRLYQQAARYDERGRLQGLLYSIATNLLRSEERRLRRWRLLAPFLSAPSPAHGFDPEPAPSTRVLQREMEREMTAALSALPLRFRVPVVLFEIEGWPLARIAAHLEVSEGTVKSRLHRGRQRLKQKLAPYWNDNAGAHHAQEPHDGPAPRREPATPA